MNRKSTTKWITQSLTTALAIGNLRVNAETFELRMAVEAISGARLNTPRPPPLAPPNAQARLRFEKQTS